MIARRITTAWLFHSVCCGIVALATPARAQVSALWQATTASTWASDGVCSSSRGSVGAPLGSSQSIGGALTFGERRALSAGVTGTGAMAAGRPLCDRRWAGLLTARASYNTHGTRFWVAYARSNALDPDTTVRQPGVSAGVERRVGPTTVAMSLGRRRDRTAIQHVIEQTPRLFPEVVFPVGGPAVQETIFVADTVTRLGRRQISDVGLGLSWTRQALGIEAGAHFGLASALRRVDPLGTLRVTYDLTARLSAIAAVTSRSSLPARNLPAAHVVTVGLRIGGGGGRRASPGTSAATATEFRVTRDTAGPLAIVIRAPRAERVEIAADFTRWAPLSLERVPGGWWRLRVRTEPGAHRISVRVDGGRWIAPPGLSPVRDEFGGTVGILVVQ